VGAAFGSGSPAPDRFGAPSDAPGANVEALFKPFHILVDGDFGKRPIDQLIQNLSEINQNLVLAGTNPAAVPQARAALDVQVATLRASAARFPSPIQDMLRKAAGEFEGDVTGVAVAQIGQALRDQVARVCQEVVTNRYPFAKGSAREVPIGDFARLFAPNGIMDTFFKEQLAPLVDTSKPVWAFKPDRPAARNLAPATLREFQRAAEIRDAFFPQGGNMPSVAIAVTPLSLAGDAAAAKLEVNGSTVMSQQGVNAPSSVMWPGPSGIGRTAISIQGKAGLFGSAPPPVGVSWDGVWSIYRMLDSGSVLKQGEALVVSHVVGGRDISYQLNVSSLQNPLTLKALQEFRCPTSI
jgi:type VI secretion system protein ImpL